VGASPSLPCGLASYGMDAAALRIEVSAALADDLGVYTLLNGETTPAISVRPEGQRLAAGTVASGLEVVILSEPRLSPVGAYLQQEAIRQFIVFLVGWDDTADTTIAAEKLVYIFPGTVWQEIPLAKRIGPTNQARVIIQSPATPGLLPTAGPRTGASNVTLVITGAAAGSSGGAITGASTLVLTLSGASTGTVAIAGTSSQSLTITGSATGVIGSVAIGSSSATLTITGSAAGSVVVSGASNQSLAIGGTSTGAVAIAGISSQVLAITGSAAGVIGAVATGASSATFTVAGTAAGAVLVTGGSAQSLAMTGSATAAVRVTGSSSQSMVLTGTSAGTVRIAGASAQTMAITGTSAATVRVTGSSAQTFAVSGSAAGTAGGAAWQPAYSGYVADSGVAAPTALFQMRSTVSDQSPNNWTVTANDVAIIAAPTALFGSTSASRRPTTGATIGASVAHSSAFNIGTGDFTIAWWQYIAGTTVAFEYPPVLHKGGYNTQGGWAVGINTESGAGLGLFVVMGGGTDTVVGVNSSMSALTLSTWQYIKLTRIGTSVVLSVNNTSVATMTCGYALNRPESPLVINGPPTGGALPHPFVKDLVFIVGSATSTIGQAVPTAPYGYVPA
jgi:hypothetical protein